jgi:homoserine dehydrogenase
MDVARKVVILARVAGMDLQLETLPVENIVPPELRAAETAEDFMDQLPQFDAYFDKLNKKARARQEVLRYVGVVSQSPGTTGRSCEVRLQSYPVAHPFAQLKGSDNVVAFYTLRFPTQPLIIQGN